MKTGNCFQDTNLIILTEEKVHLMAHTGESEKLRNFLKSVGKASLGSDTWPQTTNL